MSTVKNRLSWKKWYRRKRAARVSKGELCHGGRRTNYTGDKPGHERLANVIDEIAAFLGDTYSQLPFGLQVRSNIIGRKLASIRRHAPRMQVKV